MKPIGKISAIVDRKPDGSPIWQRVGTLLEKDNGAFLLSITRTINLAGLEYDVKRNEVYLNVFPLDEKPKPVVQSFDSDVPF